MEGIPRYLLRAVGKKDDINMESLRKAEEEGGIYEGYSDIYEEVFNDLESAREEAMVEKAISLEGEIVVDDGRDMLAGYMRYYYQHPPGWHPPPRQGGKYGTPIFWT